MPYVPTLTVSNKASAISAMLVAGGESPISVTSEDLNRPDVIAAGQLLDDVTRETLSEGWSFNTEFGYAIRPLETVEWVSNTTGRSTFLNIFKAPDDLLEFTLTQRQDQIGLDLVVRVPREWVGDAAQVFYDRTLNRDGLTNEVLYINPTWLLDFNDLPQVAKTFIMLRAMRRYLTQVVGDIPAASRVERDEVTAYRLLRRQCRIGSYNIFNNTGVNSTFGGRLPYIGGTIDTRGADTGVYLYALPGGGGSETIWGDIWGDIWEDIWGE